MKYFSAKNVFHISKNRNDNNEKIILFFHLLTIIMLVCLFFRFFYVLHQLHYSKSMAIRP